ncbi:MAG: cell wall-binding repeat-containing protein [Clostridiaceae bacterium]
MKKLLRLKYFRYLLFFLLIAALPFGSSLRSKAAVDGSVYFSMDKSSLSAGNTFTIYVKAQNISDLYGASFDIYYDCNVIQITNITCGDVFAGKNITSAKPVDDGSSGKLSFYSMMMGSTPGVNVTDGTLFVITGKALRGGQLNFPVSSSGTGALSLNNIRVKLSDSSGNPITFTSAAFPLTVTAANHRISGADRFATAVAVSRNSWTSADNVVLSYAHNFPDALAGVPFAYGKNAPILLTDMSSTPKVTLDEIKRLGAKNIYILGGTGVISSSVEASLKTSYNVIRLAGTDRFQTAIQIGNEVMKNSTSKTAVLATAYNFPDALSIGPYAAMNGIPILFTDSGSLPTSIRNFISTYKFTQILIPGGTGVISSSVETTLKNMGISVVRFSGTDRYDTELKINQYFKSSFTYGNVLATGNDFPDALSGGVAAAKLRNPIILTDNVTITSGNLSFINRSGRTDLFILGGTGVVSDNIIAQIRQ